MILSKSLTRFGLVAAVAALVFAFSAVTTGTASAQATPPANFYGKGLKAGDVVTARIGTATCGSATANGAGEWSIQVQATAACSPTENAAVSFTLNGAAATSTPAATWKGGGLPPDVANGYVLAAGAAATATPAAVTPPKTGNAGMLGSDSAASTWVVLGIALVAAGAVFGTRAYAGRTR